MVAQVRGQQLSFECVRGIVETDGHVIKHAVVAAVGWHSCQVLAGYRERLRGVVVEHQPGGRYRQQKKYVVAAIGEAGGMPL